jgi:hypothetical protein
MLGQRMQIGHAGTLQQQNGIGVEFTSREPDTYSPWFVDP